MVICVECAAPVSCVYRRFPSSSQENIRLQRCDACGTTADKYVEYEGLLLFVELVLHKPQTYRHILFNRLPYADAGLPAPLYRLAAACILFDAYTIWFLLHVDHARFLYTSAEDEVREGRHMREEQAEQYRQHQPVSEQVEEAQLRLQQRPHHQQHLGTQQHFEHQKRGENQLRLGPVVCSHCGENSQRVVSAVSGTSIDRVRTVGEPLVTLDPFASSRSRCCRFSVSDGTFSPAAATLSVDAPSVGTAADLRSTAASDSVGTGAAASAGASPASVYVPVGAPAAPTKFPPDSQPSGAAASPHHAVVLQQDEETGSRPGSFSASSPGNFYSAELKGRAATTFTYLRPENVTMPSSTRRQPVVAATAVASQRAPASWAGATDAQKHADMVRWLLHNPVVSVDQQLLILSVSIVDFLVYIFAIIFLTDLFLRFSFRRKHTQKRRPRQQKSRGAISSVCTPEAAAAARRIASPVCSCHTLPGIACGSGSQCRLRALKGRRHSPYADRRRGTRVGEGETRQRQEGEEWHVRTEENRQHPESSVQQRADEAEEREKLVQQDAKRLTKGELREADVCQEDGSTAFGARFDAEEKEQRREEVMGPTQKEIHDTGSLVSTETPDVKSRGGCLGEKAWVAMSSSGDDCSVEASSCTFWTQGSMFLSSLWRFSVLSAWTAARELLSLLFGCGKNEGETFAPAAAEGRGVVLIKYNYLAAAVTLSMFGKLGALVLMAWEESLSPRCFTSLFTLTSNVLAVDVFLNSQHHAAAATIVTAAAVVRAFARLAEQLAFPSVAFPPCALFTAAEPGNAEQLSPVLSFIALLL